MLGGGVLARGAKYLFHTSEPRERAPAYKLLSYLALIASVHRPPDFSDKSQAEVIRARHKIIWTGQDYPTGNSRRRETKRQTEETMGRQHQRVTGLEWNTILWKAEHREERRKLVLKSTVVPQRSARLRDRD